ncbi:HlyD family efflux transporter periplasmic adaptor subunit [Solimonas sp. C16B3]|uniref:HlyD family efflux transporter periplasmic adaptor subunit n=2 Tax=Solimonas marina TaxID=2714601 RepID=A0A969W706_9GAMM|nr:HlyD family secretion protein [Solimonas marina]NKF21836.1 HlyD family efflux transporter periplasmic adaptor subunit [Solimonas marina]
MVDTDQINVATKLPARVLQIDAHEGDAVHAGQLLATLSSPEVDASRLQAQAGLSGAQALQTRVDHGTRAENRASLASIWRGAEAAATLARKTAQRAENLYREGVISEQRRDEAVAARDVAVGNADAARQQYEKAQAGARPEDRQLANAQVDIARAGVMETDALHDETRVSAPIDGEIAKRLINTGELALPGVPLFTMIDLHRLWVSVNLREDQFHALKMHQVLYGSVPALDVRRAAFAVTYIAPQGEFATWRATRQSRGFDVRSFEVRLRPQQPLDGLRPGMSVLFDWPQ